MGFKKRPVLALFSSGFLALLAQSSANASLLFQDRHLGPDGEQVVYRFEAKAQSAAETVEQSKAIKTAVTWATQYYGLGSVAVAMAQERMMPTHFWLIALTAPDQSKGGTYYSIILPDGSVVEPKVSRQNLTATANPIDVTKDAELKAPIKGLEVHGEIVFTYGFGKGLRYYGPCTPYVPSPVWDGPPAPVRPAQ